MTTMLLITDIILFADELCLCKAFVTEYNNYYNKRITSQNTNTMLICTKDTLECFSVVAWHRVLEL